MKNSILLTQMMIGASTPLAAIMTGDSGTVNIPCINIKYCRTDLSQRPLPAVSLNGTCRLRVCEIGTVFDFAFELVLEQGEIGSVGGVPIGTLPLRAIPRHLHKLTLEVQFIEDNEIRIRDQFVVKLMQGPPSVST